MTLYTDIAAAYSGSGSGRVGDLLTYTKGEETLTSTVTISSVSGMRIRGSGRSRKFRWAGPTADPVFKFLNCSDCTLEDFEIVLDNACGDVVTYQDDSAGAIRSSRNGIRNVWVLNNAAARPTNGIHVEDAAGKNDLHWAEHFVVQGYTGVGVLNECRSSVNNYYADCKFQGRNVGSYGVRTIDGGTATFIRCSIMENNTADIDLDTRHGVTRFLDCHSEDSVRWVTSPSPSPSINAGTCVLDGFRFAWSAPPSVSDTDAISWLGGGNLVVVNCTIGLSSNLQPYTYRYSDPLGGGGIGQFGFRANRINSSTQFAHFPAISPYSTQGSRLYIGGVVNRPFRD